MLAGEPRESGSNTLVERHFECSELLLVGDDEERSQEKHEMENRTGEEHCEMMEGRMVEPCRTVVCTSMEVDCRLMVDTHTGCYSSCCYDYAHDLDCYLLCLDFCCCCSRVLSCCCSSVRYCFVVD